MSPSGDSQVDPWLSIPVTVQNVINEIPGVATYELAWEDPVMASTFCYQPGQFNMLYLPGVGEVAISVSGSNGPLLQHTIREAGNVTHAIAELKPGMGLGLRGPFGSCWPLAHSEGKDILLVAGGIGLAPVRPVIQSVLAEPPRFGKLTVLHGARSPSGLLYQGEYDSWRKAGIDVQIIVDRADPSWTGQVGVITQLLDRLPLNRPAETIMMSCGPEVMMHFAARSAMARGISSQQIWISLERHMNCAIGLCGHCQLGPTFVCKDGPVYRHDLIAPLMKIEGL